MRPTTRRAIHRVYDVAQAGLWGLAGIELVLGAYFILTLPQSRAVAERLRIEAISDEDRRYCGKWGMHPGTHEYAGCTLDLMEIRQNHEKRLAEDAGLL